MEVVFFLFCVSVCFFFFVFFVCVWCVFGGVCWGVCGVVGGGWVGGLFDCKVMLKCLYTISPFSCLFWDSIVEFVYIWWLFSHFQLTLRELIWDITRRCVHSYDESREDVSPDKHVLLTDLIWSPPGLVAYRYSICGTCIITISWQS